MIANRTHPRFGTNSPAGTLVEELRHSITLQVLTSWTDETATGLVAMAGYDVTRAVLACRHTLQ
jgi:hypothetical protein